MDDGLKEVRVSEYIYHSKGTPLCDVDGEISLPRSEIVRCRDCKHYTHEKSDWCHFHGDIAWSTNGFCAWGERKEVRDD